MKKTALTIALALAATGLTFAGQNKPATTPTEGTAQTAPKAKKHKKVKKTKKHAGAPAPAAQK